MKKISTLYLAISSGIAIAMLIFTLLAPYNYITNIFFICIPIILIPNYFIRRHIKASFKEMESIYINECDPQRYLEAFEKSDKYNISTTMSRYFHKIRKADFLCECLKFKEARVILDELLEVESQMNNALLSYYYKVWISYFIEFGHFDRVQVLLEQMQQLPQTSTNDTMHMFCNSMYFSCLAKYNVLTKRDLDNTEKYFASLVNSNAGKAYIVSGMYYLSLIAIEKGEIEKAKRRSKYVYEHGNKLSYVSKIEPILNYLDNYNNSNIEA